MSESHFEALLVVGAHLVDSLFVDVLSHLVSESAQEVSEYLTDPLCHFGALHPLA